MTDVYIVVAGGKIKLWVRIKCAPREMSGKRVPRRIAYLGDSADDRREDGGKKAKLQGR